MKVSLLSQVSQSAGNDKPIIDYKKVLAARTAVWTLESLGIKLEEPISSEAKPVKEQKKCQG